MQYSAENLFLFSDGLLKGRIALQSETATRLPVDVPLGHWIGGEPVLSSRTFSTYSPIDGAFLGDVACGGAADIDRAVKAAEAAAPAWGALGATGRSEILEKFAAGILAERESLALVETLDNGSLLAVNRDRFVPRAAQNMTFFANRALTLDHALAPGAEANDRVRYAPSGVTAIITPWNAPLMLSTWRIGPALASGNTVVLKPAEWAPLTCAMLARIATEAGVPDGVFNVVQGFGEEAGASLTSHPGVTRIAFTGSGATGKRVLKAAAENLTPCSLELGGKSPLIVFEDADLDVAARIAAMQYNNAGQVCLAGTRLLVAESIAYAFTAKLTELASRLVVGDPRLAETNVGPLILDEHFARVDGFVRRAIENGARVVYGGGPASAGSLYYKPTLLENVETASEIVQSEVFGPVLTLQTFSTEDEAVTLANATRYGLAASVVTADRERARRVAERVVAGTVWINSHYIRNLEAPFGGSRSSGIGREGGIHSFDFYCDIQTISEKNA